MGSGRRTRRRKICKNRQQGGSPLLALAVEGNPVVPLALAIVGLGAGAVNEFFLKDDKPRALIPGGVKQEAPISKLLEAFPEIKKDTSFSSLVTTNPLKAFNIPAPLAPPLAPARAPPAPLDPRALPAPLAPAHPPPIPRSATIEKIKCPNCTFDNPKGSTNCEICEVNLSITKEELDAKRSEKYTPLNKRTQEGWACRVCTLVNPYDKKRCQACDALRPDGLVDFPRPQKAENHKDHQSLVPAQTAPPPLQTGTGRFRGLNNVGNTCWMNSSLQALYSCDAFANIFLLDQQPIIRSNTNGLIGNIIQLFKACRDSPPKKPVDPTSFKVALSKVFPQYNNTNQHDSALFIWSLLDKLCDIVGHPPGTVPLDWKDTRFPVKNNEISPSIVRDIFGLKEYRIKTYHPCNHAVELSTVFNSMLILNIPNNPNPTLAQCLNNYALQEGLIENSICGACGKASNKNDKSLKLINAPQMLLMNIARFSIDGGIASKNETPISIPLILENLGNLSTEETNKYTYQLTGVVHHSGTLTGGHYTASVRMNDGTWLYCNDSTITKKDTAEFQREMQEQNGPFKAVVLVYSRMNKNPKVGGKYGNTTKRRKRCPIRRIKKQNRS